MNTTLYILTGLPYSGKTTLRKELIRRFSFKTVSIDEIMDERAMWREGHPTQEDWNIAYSEAYRRIKEHLTDGNSVIFDYGNLPLHERENARKIADSLGIPHKLIYINTPKEEILRRRQENEETKERGQLDQEMMDRALNMFVEPTEKEKPIIYNYKMNLDQWIKINIT
ncbi:MAG TPA: ATP-binding protein [Patescibacteria group bacterium]|nr:ATP-binding protein [Patescibacteria group bacterium]